MISVKQINNVKTAPIPSRYFGETDNRPARGYKLFEEAYSNILILAKKNSGKTHLIYNILKKCIDKNTTVIIFSSSHNNDKAYSAIKKWLKKRGNPMQCYTHFIDEDKVDILDDMLRDLEDKHGNGEDSDDEEKEEKKFYMYGGSEEEEEKKRESKYKPLEYIFILDDLSKAMRHRTIAKLVKVHRHYKSKVIISTQYPNDVQPETIQQCQYLILFPGHSEAKLKELYKHLDISIEFDLFLELYHKATEEKYNFLYVFKKGRDEFRKNFNIEYEVK